MPASTTKKAKKTGQQPVPKSSPTDATPSKTMKRKKEDLEAPSVSASKKLKKDTVIEKATADSKKKSKSTVESTAPKANMKEPATPSEVEHIKSKSKPKDASNPEPPAPATTKAKETLKKATKSVVMPTSISRPKNTQKSKTSAKSKPSKSSSPGPEVDGDAEKDNAQDSDDGELLHGFSTDDDDSSEDEDAMDVEPSDFDVAKLPTIAKDDATVKRKLEKAKKQPTEDHGVLFLGRLPHGFYEDQLKAYFSQFGEVTRLRVSRNKKTGASKHYGFIEFESSAVAQIVADTMDNYLLMGHILRCKVIPKDQVHPELWVGANRKWRPVPKARLARVHHNKPRTEEEQDKAAKRLLKRQEQRKQKLAKAGIDYDFDAVSYKKPVTA
ncbi:hypothetical protein D9613_007718 [Agrocybe pediades]|uniref:RRM domain-containing protein n=1 Tax=Agrocybe pediades TaxID=84607 RepID=A0A8H4VLT3_9AGAR|nr:hypothetical protein D9613_007718 [Agrocybe pediades]